MSPTLKQIYDMALHLLEFSGDASKNVVSASERMALERFRTAMSNEIELLQGDSARPEIPGYPRKQGRRASKSPISDSDLNLHDQDNIDDYGAF